jgi:hypothetical protein
MRVARNAKHHRELSNVSIARAMDAILKGSRCTARVIDTTRHVTKVKLLLLTVSVRCRALEFCSRAPWGRKVGSIGLSRDR